MEKLEPIFDLLDENLFVDSVHKQINSISASSIENAKKYIDNQIRLASAEGNQHKLHLLQIEKLKYRFNRRVELRVKVPAGMMDIIYSNDQGQEQTAIVIDISLKALLFMDNDFDEQKITQIRINQVSEPLSFKIPSDNKQADNKQAREVLNINAYKLRKRDDSHYVLLLNDFENDLVSRMRWVELITRIEEMSN